MSDSQYFWIIAPISVYGLLNMIVVRAWGKKILDTLEGEAETMTIAQGTKRACEICRGSRIVRLPIYRPVSARIDAAAAVSIDPAYRVYPCPECGDSVHQDRVAVLDAHTFVDSRIDDPEFQTHIREAAAHQLVAHLLAGNFITFERGPTDARELRYPMIATLGVVSPGQVATLEERAAERQDLLAKAVVDASIEQISNWGSHFGRDHVLKREAYNLMHEAFRRVSTSWSKARALQAKTSR